MTEATENTLQNSQAQPEGEKSAMPEGLPESFWDADKSEVKLNDLLGDYKNLSEFKAKTEGQFVNRPEAADKYELKLPEAFEMPEGMGFEFDPESEMAKLGRELAWEKGYSQDEFIEKLVTPYVKEQLSRAGADQADADEFFKAEKSKLGEKADDRIKAVNAYVGKNLSKEQAKALEAVATTAAGVEAIEKLINMANGRKVQTDGDSTDKVNVSEADLRAKMDDPRYWREKDPAFVKEVTDGFKKLYPGQVQTSV